MAHVILANQRTPTGPSIVPDSFYGYWLLTRAMLAAGWKYKGSGDATAGGVKSTDGNWLGDKWGVGGGVNLNATVQSGQSSDAMTANNDGTVTHIITGGGFSATLSVGRYLTITNAVNASNNGTFRIVAYTSATTVKTFNPASTSETTVVQWAERHGGANGSITAAGTAGATPGRAIFSVSSGTPFVAPTAFPVNRGSVGDRLTVIGATTGANNGTYIITRVISSTSVEIDNASATTDAGNPTLSWAQCSPTQQSYPASINATTVGTGAWICLQGPSTMKIAIGTNVPSGAFRRGEMVTQTTSGATGTITGCITDAAAGFLVIEPRLNGTGGGPRGWTTGGTDTVTGAVSGVTITSAATAPIEFVREFVIWKNTAVQGHVFTQTVDNAAENGSRFSVLAAAAGVTNVLAPGGPTGTFPAAGSYVMFGTGGSNTVGTGQSNWYNYTTTNFTGSIQIMCATCIENSSEGADGSWTLLGGVSGTDNYIPSAFMRMDGAEDGDLDPYVSVAFNAATVYGAARTALALASVYTTNPMLLLATAVCTATATHIRGWRRRGYGSTDAYQDFSLGCLTNLVTTNAVVSVNNTYPCKVANHPNPNIPIREALHVVSVGPAAGPLKMRKGYFRWWFITEGGACNRLLFNGAYMQTCTPPTGAAAGGPIACGPWDGVSTPTNGY